MLGTYHLSILYDILKEIHFLYQSDKIYTFLLESLMKAVDADAASFFVADHEKETLVLKAAIGPKKNILEIVAEDTAFPFGRGVCGWVAQYNQGVIVEDANKDERFSSVVDSLIGYKTKSILCVPLSNGKQVIAVIEILNKKSLVFNKNDLDLLTLIAKQAAISLENAKLYAKINEEKVYIESILANLTGGIITVDAKETVTHMNPTAERILAIEPGTSTGQGCSIVLKDYPGLYQEMVKTLTSKEKIARQTLQCVRPDGGAFPLGYSTFLISDQAQNSLGAGVNFQDLSAFQK